MSTRIILLHIYCLNGALSGALTQSGNKTLCYFHLSPKKQISQFLISSVEKFEYINMYLKNIIRLRPPRANHLYKPTSFCTSTMNLATNATSASPQNKPTFSNMLTAIQEEVQEGDGTNERGQTKKSSKKKSRYLNPWSPTGYSEKYH